jgi:hypothetical protein
MQLPLLHTWFVPQGVPSDTFPLAAHVCVPVEHEVVPVAHGWPLGVHDAPAVHATHARLLHTWLVPQVVPLGACASVSTHAIPASEQMTLPTLHAAVDGTHGAPFVHGWQAPLSQ